MTRDPLSERVHLCKAEFAASTVSGMAGSRRAAHRPRLGAGTDARQHVSDRRGRYRTEPPTMRRSARSGSSFYIGMRMLPRAATRRRCSRSTPSAARSTTSPTIPVRARERLAELQQWRARCRRALCRRPAAADARPCSAGPGLRLAREDFSRHHRRHGNGCRRRHPRAGSGDARSLLRSGRERGRASFGAGLRHGPHRRHRARPSSRPRACSSPTSCAISTRMPRSAGSICRARR